MKHLSETELLRYYNKARSPDTHKGDYGRVYILAGSRGMTGAAVLCARAALRSGAGLVYLISPGALVPIYEICCQEAVKIPLDKNGEHFSKEHITKAAGIIKSAISKTNGTSSAQKRIPNIAVVIGPGIGADADSKQFVKGMLDELKGSGIPVVLDADGLNAFAGECSQLKCRCEHCKYCEHCEYCGHCEHCESNIIITPHAAELARLTGMELSYINKNRAEAALKAAELTGTITVLKGNGSITAAASHTDEKIYDINKSGNPGMASGGSGDVLSGIIAGITAADRDAATLYDITRCAVYIHGLCGDIAAARFGQRAVIAGDLIEMLKEVHNYGI